MSEYKRVPTSAEVWAVIRARHPEMVVFSSYSAPDGDEFSVQSRMFTSYGFPGADFPVMEAETTWDRCQEAPYARQNEQHRYWLCLPVESNE
jgi:hypothetical protein